MVLRNTTVSVLAAVLGCALLASCGGGDDTPTPTPTPTPTSTPTPMPTVDFDFTKAFTASATGTSYGYAYFTPNSGGTEVWSEGSRRGGTSKITYAVSPEKVTFDWPDTLAIPDFTSADLQSATPTLRVYRKGTDGLTLELPYGEALRVSFETKQAFTRDTVAGMLRSFRNAIFFNPVTVSGVVTTILDYTGTPEVVGGKSGTTPSGVYAASATTIRIDGTATDKKVTGTIRIFENVGGVAVERAALVINGTLSGNTFTGTAKDTANKFEGSIAGSLAGANREELVLLFNVASTDTADGREFIGSLIAAR